VQYDNVLLGDGPHFVTFDIPMTAVQPPRELSASSPFHALAGIVHDTQSIITGTINQETSMVAVESSQESSSQASMSTGAIAGIAVGSAAALLIIIVAVVVVMARSASAASAVSAKYLTPPVAAAAVGAATVGPAPTASIKEDFFAPHVSGFAIASNA